MKKVFSSLFIVTFFLFLILCPAKAVHSAAAGLSLWMNTLIPTLLPVMILSNLLVITGISSLIVRPFFPFFHKMFGTSPSGTYALLCGFLCGFPMGSKILADLCEQNAISKKEAQKLCPFCNNVSPAFVSSYLIGGFLPFLPNHLIVFLILYGAPLLYGMFTCAIHRQYWIDSSLSSNKASFTAPTFAMIDACITNGIHSITKLGGYIVIFSVCAEIINQFFVPWPLLSASLTSLMEMTTGITQIASLNLDKRLSSILLITCAAFGGLCTAVQSQLMLRTIQLPIGKYLKARFFIAILAAFLSGCFFL